MKKLYFVGGSSGTGKSTLLSYIKKNDDIKIVSSGDIYNLIINKIFNLNIDRDYFKYTNWKYFEPFVVSSLCSIIEYIDIDKLIIDTHYSVYNLMTDNFEMGLNKESINCIGKIARDNNYNYCLCILIDSDIEELYNRVIKDKNRKREIALDFLIKEKESNLNFSKEYVNILSKYIKTEFKKIKNGYLEYAIKELEEVLSY